MQTTLRLDDELFRRAKAQAAVAGISLTKLVEQAIREHLEKPLPVPRHRRLCLPVSSVAGGLALGFSTLEGAVAAADLAADQGRAVDPRDACAVVQGLDWWNPVQTPSGA